MKIFNTAMKFWEGQRFIFINWTGWRERAF